MIIPKYKPGNVITWNGCTWIVTKQIKEHIHLVHISSDTTAKVDWDVDTPAILSDNVKQFIIETLNEVM